MAREQSVIILGRGDLFFDRFNDSMVGEGEVLFGNTTDLSITRTVNFTERYCSMRGVKHLEKSYGSQETQRLSFTTDQMTADNVALWFGADVADTFQEAAGTIAESFIVKLGRYYQLGKSRQLLGLRHVDYVHFYLAGVELDPVANFDLDLEAGRFQVLQNAPALQDGSAISVIFEDRQTRRSIAVASQKSVEGSLRFVAANLRGPNRNYFFPRVRISPRSELDLLAERAWQSLKFDADVMKLNSSIELSYADEASNVGLTGDEQAIVDGGLLLSEFPDFENQFDTVINVTMPAHVP